MPPKKVKRADGLYQVTATVGFDENGKRLRKVFYGKTQKEAAQKRDEYLEGIAVSADARTMTVRRWANTWLERYSRGGYRNQARGWLRWSAHPFGGVVCRGMCCTLLLLLNLRKWQLEF